jgi:hypothetical protein
MAAAGPVLAQATAFDGTYAGVSADFRIIGGGKCPPPQTPSPLIVANGTAHSQTGFYQGTVAADGKVVLRGKDLYYQGQIDGSGTLKATGTSSYCEYTVTWQKR